MPKQKKELTHDALVKKLLIPILRRTSVRWYARNEVFKRQRVGPNQFTCQMCGAVFPRDKMHVDHIEPVMSVRDSWQGWDVYIERLFVKPEQLQLLDEICHASKTLVENELRKKVDKKKKK